MDQHVFLQPVQYAVNGNAVNFFHPLQSAQDFWLAQGRVGVNQGVEDGSTRFGRAQASIYHELFSGLHG